MGNDGSNDTSDLRIENRKLKKQMEKLKDELKESFSTREAAFDLCHETENRNVRLERNNRKLKMDHNNATNTSDNLKTIVKHQAEEHAIVVTQLINNVVNNDIKKQIYKTILMSDKWTNINGEKELDPDEWINEVTKLALAINKLDAKSSEEMKTIANGIIKLAGNKRRVHAEQWNNFQKIFLEFYFNGKIKIGNAPNEGNWINQKKKLLTEIKRALSFANFSFEMPNTSCNLDTSAALQIQYCFEKLNKTFKVSANVSIGIIEDFIEFLQETGKILESASEEDKSKDITEYLGNKYLDVAANVHELLDMKL